jgi:DNA-binding response OmpR family regulator
MGRGDADLSAVEAFLLGDCRDRRLYPKMIKNRTRAPEIAMNETPCLGQTLDLFAAGVDDVVRKPIHVREILARVGAIRRRHECTARLCRVAGLFRRPGSATQGSFSAIAAARAPNP